MSDAQVFTRSPPSPDRHSDFRSTLRDWLPMKRSSPRAVRVTSSLLLLLPIVLAGCQSLPVPRIDAEPPLASRPPGRDEAPGPAGPTAAAPSAASSPVSSPLPETTGGTTKPLRQAQDLWGRLRRGFGWPELAHPLVAQHAQRFAASGFLVRRADRIQLYLPLIIEELEQRRLPLELALLPMVESALDPHARSPVGAIGPWQFMRPTAQRFELRTSRLVDDRHNLRAATRAAAEYLARLHEQFGDWHLAAAAYNWGEGRVQAAVTRQRARGAPVDFVSLAAQMPAETRHYVPQIAALARIVSDPALFGVELPDIPDGNPLVEVELRQDIDLNLALRFAGLPEAKFLRVNPSVRAPVVLAAATPQLLLPADAASRFQLALQSHAGRTSSWRAVKLARTQPVEAVASAHAASATALRAVNQIPRGTKPVAGSVLLVPSATTTPGSRVDDAVVASARLDVVPDTVRVSTMAHPRETPRDVARRCGVPLASLLAWNGLAARAASRKLSVGQPLTLWVLRERASAFEAPRGRDRPRRPSRP